MAITGAILFVAGTAASIQQGKKATKLQRAALGEQRKAQADQQRIAEIKNLRQQRQLIRQGRIQRAQVLQAGVTQTGGVTGTAVTGGAAGIVSQAGAEAGFRSAVTAGATEANIFLQQASIFEGQAIARSSKAATFGAVADLGAFGFSNAAKIGSIFSSGFKNPPAVSTPTGFKPV